MGQYVNPITNPVAGAMSMLPINASSFGGINYGGGPATAAQDSRSKSDPNANYNLTQILQMLRTFSPGV